MSTALGAIGGAIDRATLACLVIRGDSISGRVRCRNHEAQRQVQCYPIHVKFDTGMGRLGLLPTMTPALFDALQTLRNVHLDGLMTHLATADLADDCAEAGDDRGHQAEPRLPHVRKNGAQRRSAQREASMSADRS